MQLLTREDFIKKYANSIEKICKGTGVFPQTLFAIAIVESQAKAQDGKYYVGLSPLAKDYNNYFGIKATANWKGKKVKLNTMGGVGEFILRDTDHIHTYTNPAITYPGLLDTISKIPKDGGSVTRDFYCGITLYQEMKKAFYDKDFLRYKCEVLYDIK